jgi:hypothetical protein
VDINDSDDCIRDEVETSRMRRNKVNRHNTRLETDVRSYICPIAFLARRELESTELGQMESHCGLHASVALENRSGKRARRVAFRAVLSQSL